MWCISRLVICGHAISRGTVLLRNGRPPCSLGKSQEPWLKLAHVHFPLLGIHAAGTMLSQGEQEHLEKALRNHLSKWLTSSVSTIHLGWTQSYHSWSVRINITAFGSPFTEFNGQDLGHISTLCTSKCTVVCREVNPSSKYVDYWWKDLWHMVSDTWGNIAQYSTLHKQTLESEKLIEDKLVI